MTAGEVDLFIVIALLAAAVALGAAVVSVNAAARARREFHPNPYETKEDSDVDR